MSAASYQTAFDDMKQKGYRPVCISGYTENGKELYEALWQKPASTPAWEARHGMSAASYQSSFDDLAKKGYRLTWISGYAVNGQPKFAGIWEKSSGTVWAARHNMTAASYQTAFNDMKRKGYRLRQVCGYAVGTTPYFAAIWDKSPGGAWEAHHNMTAAQYQSTFNDLDAKGYVLTCVSGYRPGSTDYYAAIWEKKSSPLWWARHSIPAMNYQHAFDNMYYQGYYPVYLNAFASGSTSRYNVIWNNTSMKWSDISTIDKAAQGYMKDQNVSGLSLAVCKDGRLVFAKSYGYADKSTGEELCPSHPMRIMSVSKGVTGCGIAKLWEQDNSILKKKVFGPNSILGSKFSTPSNMSKLNNITLEMLLWHTSGLRSCNGESVFWQSAKTKTDALNALLAMGDLIAAPNKIGDTFIYSNTNFLIASLVIEQLSGQSYENWIRSKILAPAGVANTMYVGNANGESRSNECVYIPEKKMNLQEWAGFGGWVARPMDLVRYLAHVDGDNSVADVMTKAAHDKLTTGSPTNMGYGFGWNVSGDQQSHNGCFDGTRSFLVELPNGLSYAVIVNSNPDNDGCGWTMKGKMEPAVKGVSAWPSYDLY
jgi:CubicO group peptidase (beta-lactamase class C family)